MVVHSSGASLENVMVIIGGKGERTILKAAYIDDMATANIDYGINLRVTSRSMLGTMVLGTTKDHATMTLEDEWIAIHCMSIEIIAGVVVIIYGADTHPNFGAPIHMGDFASIDSAKVAFNEYTWKGRVAILRTILRLF